VPHVTRVEALTQMGMIAPRVEALTQMGMIASRAGQHLVAMRKSSAPRHVRPAARWAGSGPA
jgi:hypothetical protein